MGNTNSNVNIRLSVSGKQQVVSAFTQIHNAVGLLSRAVPQLTAVLSVAGLVGALHTAADAGARLVREAINGADAMGKLAEKAGQVVEEISALNYSADLSEVTQEQLIRASKELANTMAEEGRASESLREEFLQLADAMARLPTGAARIALANDRLGKSGQEMIPWLSQGREAIEAQMREAEALGLVIGPRFAGNADQFNDNLKRIRSILKGLANQVAAETLPDMIRLTQVVIDANKNWHLQAAAVGIVLNQYRGLAVTFAILHSTIVSMGAVTATFFGALSGGASFTDAWAAATQELEKQQDALADRLAEISRIGKSEADRSQGAAAKWIETENKKIELLKKELELKDRVSRQVQTAVDRRFDLTDPEKRAAKLKFIRDDIEQTQKALEKLIADFNALTAPTKEDKDTFKQSRDLTASRLTGLFESRDAIEATPDPNSMRDQFVRVMTEMRNEAGTAAESIARTFKSVIGDAVNAISNGITELIKGTVTWGQALSQIGTSVLNSLIERIVKMGVEWVVQHGIMEAASIALNIKVIALGWARVAAENAMSIAKRGAQMISALLTAISEGGWGAVALIALAAAGLGAGIAWAAGAFEEGGYTGDGPRSAPAGIVHRREWVIPADAVATLGHSNMAEIQRGRLPVVSPQIPSGSQSADREIGMKVYFDKQQMLSEIRTSATFENHIIDVVGRNQHRFRG